MQIGNVETTEGGSSYRTAYLTYKSIWHHTKQCNQIVLLGSGMENMLDSSRESDTIRHLLHTLCPDLIVKWLI